MKIQAFSDVHLETGPFRPADTNADVIVAAGDIEEGMAGLEWLRTLGKPVIYVGGNHEGYGQPDILENYRKLKAACKGTNAHFLEREAVVIDDTRFLGATLWTSYRNWDPAAVRDAYSHMNDYAAILAPSWYTKENQLTMVRRLRAVGVTDPIADVATHARLGSFHPVIAYGWHLETVTWLREQLLQSFNGKTVVVTHHAPSYESLGLLDLDRGILKPGTVFHPGPVRIAGYASDLDYLLGEHQIDLWVHGHTHWANDYLRHGCRIVSNPRGYFDPGGARRGTAGATAPGFRDDLVIEI
jgi:predicted phosphodiesterase